MAITKEKTNNCKTYDAARIIAVGLNDGVGYVRFLNSTSGREMKFPVTKDEYAHAATGAGTSIDAFDNGLSKAFRYRFLICTNPDESTGKETITAVHAAPLDSYMGCDWSVEMDKRIPEGGVFCTFRENGGIDMNTFPVQFSQLTPHVLGKLAELDSISTTTMFTVEGVDCKIKSLDGNDCMLVMKRKNRK